MKRSAVNHKVVSVRRVSIWFNALERHSQTESPRFPKVLFFITMDYPAYRRYESSRFSSALFILTWDYPPSARKSLKPIQNEALVCRLKTGQSTYLPLVSCASLSQLHEQNYRIFSVVRVLVSGNMFFLRLARKVFAKRYCH